MEFDGNEGHNNIERAGFYLWKCCTTKMGHESPDVAQNGEGQTIPITSAVGEQIVLRRRCDGKSHLGDLSRVIIGIRPPTGRHKRTARLFVMKRAATRRL